jgi:hypothetical protein
MRRLVSSQILRRAVCAGSVAGDIYLCAVRRTFFNLDIPISKLMFLNDKFEICLDASHFAAHHDAPGKKFPQSAAQRRIAFDALPSPPPTAARHSHQALIDIAKISRSRGPAKTKPLPERIKTMNTSTPVRKAFGDACAFRSSVPLPSGRFKLEEALWQIQRIRSDVEKIRQIVRKKDAKAAKAAMVSISPEERAHLIKRIPLHVANKLGRYILPGIAELAGDGVAKRDVAELMTHAKAESTRILAAAEEAHSRLKAGIKTEYDVMRAGGSHVVPLLDDAERLVMRALAACPPDP